MMGIPEGRASNMRWRAILSGGFLITFLSFNPPAIAQDCESLKPIKPVDTQIRDKTEAQANTVLKSLLSGSIKNEYERIASNVSGDEVHKWDTFVYMVCTILRDSKMSPQEKLGQLSILIQLKGQAPPPTPATPSQPHSSIQTIAKLAELGSAQDAIRKKYPGGSYSVTGDGAVTYKFNFKILLPSPVSHVIDATAIAYFDRTNIVNKTVWMIETADRECYDMDHDNKDYRDGIFNLLVDNLGRPVRREQRATEVADKPSELRHYGLPARPPEFPGVTSNRPFHYFELATYWFNPDNVQAKLLTGWPCVEEVILERM